MTKYILAFILVLFQSQLSLAASSELTDFQFQVTYGDKISRFIYSTSKNRSQLILERTSESPKSLTLNKKNSQYISEQAGLLLAQASHDSKFCSRKNIEIQGFDVNGTEKKLLVCIDSETKLGLSTRNFANTLDLLF